MKSMMKNGRQTGATALTVVVVILAVAIGAMIFMSVTKAKRKADIELQAKIQASAAAEQEARNKVALEAKALEIRKSADDRRSTYKKSLDAVDAISTRWVETLAIAQATPRIALSSQLQVLQSVKSEAAQLAVPPCLDSGKVDLLKAMSSVIEGFIVFMANQDKLGSILSAQYFDDYKLSFDRFKAARRLCPEAPPSSE